MMGELYKNALFTRFNFTASENALPKMIQFPALATNHKASKMLSLEECLFNAIQCGWKMRSYNSHKLAKAAKDRKIYIQKLKEKINCSIWYIML